MFMSCSFAFRVNLFLTRHVKMTPEAFTNDCVISKLVQKADMVEKG